MKIASVEIIRTSQTGFSILVINEVLPQSKLPLFQQQCRTVLAEYIKRLIEQDQLDREKWKTLLENESR
jgi:hypothetical protein